MGKKKRTLKDLKNYTSSNNQAMKDVVDGKFDGDMDAFNDWWSDRSDGSLDSWEKCRDELSRSSISSHADNNLFEEYLIHGDRVFDIYDTGIAVADSSSEGDSPDRGPITPTEDPHLKMVDLYDFEEKQKSALPGPHIHGPIMTGLASGERTNYRLSVNQGNTDLSFMDRNKNAPEDVKKEHDGTMNDCIREPFPAYISGPCDTALKGYNNTWIVLGRDRWGDLSTGYGGAGHTQSGAIDLVVGRMGYGPKEKDEDNELISTDPDFTTDAARIYISQKTNIDENFNLADGGVGKKEARSGVGIKADNVRIIAREGIKLVTKTDLKNGQGGDVKTTDGIDLIAGNDDSDLQPMAKGENLKEAVERLTHHVSKLNGIVDAMMMAQNQFNIALTHHFHISPFNGIPTSPSPPVVVSGIQTMVTYLKDVKLSLMTQKANLELYKANYLTPAGCGYILSRYNKVN